LKWPSLKAKIGKTKKSKFVKIESQRKTKQKMAVVPMIGLTLYKAFFILFSKFVRNNKLLFKVQSINSKLSAKLRTQYSEDFPHF
jgi:hypothetical protein